MKNKPIFLSGATHIKFILAKDHVQLHDCVLSDQVNWNGGFSFRHEGLLLVSAFPPSLLAHQHICLYLPIPGTAFVPALAWKPSISWDYWTKYPCISFFHIRGRCASLLRKLYDRLFTSRARSSLNGNRTWKKKERRVEDILIKLHAE